MRVRSRPNRITRLRLDPEKLISGGVSELLKYRYSSQFSIGNRDRFALEAARSLPSDQRDELNRRILRYLRSRRRGRLFLPNSFGREVRDWIASLSKTEMHRSIWTFRPGSTYVSGSAVHKLHPKQSWGGKPSYHAYRLEEVGISRLRPKIQKSLTLNGWPSYPTICEMAGMIRCGLKPIRPHPRPIPRPDGMRLADLDDIRIANKVVRSNIIAIRQGSKVPERYFSYFRRRQGFLFLTTRHCMPAGLVRFLLGQWKTRLYNLWLVQPTPLKYYLRGTRRPVLPERGITSNRGDSPPRTASACSLEIDFSETDSESGRESDDSDELFMKQFLAKTRNK